MKRFLEWLKAPHGPGLAIVYLFTAVCIAVSLTFVIAAPTNRLFVYCSYASFLFAAVTLGYSVYAVVYSIRHVYQKIAKKNAFLARMKDDFSFRTTVFACCSFAFTICYTAFNGVISVLAVSIWYGALTVYYGVLAFLRGGVLISGFRRRKSTETEQQRYRMSAYRTCGIFLIVLTIALAGALVQMIRDKRLFAYTNVSIYVAALYATLKIIFAVINLFKAKKQENLSVQAIRNVNFADALVSVLALQAAMLSVFRDQTGALDTTLMNASVGTIVCLVIIGMGISMIVSSIKNKPPQNAED